MSLDVHIRPKLAGLRLAPRQNQRQCVDDPLDIVRFIRGDRFDVIRVGQGPEKKRLDHREHRRGRADPKRKSNDRRETKARRFN